MPNIAIAFRDEITRLARKEIRRECAPLRKTIVRQRHELAALKVALGQAVRDLSRVTKTIAVATPTKPAVDVGRQRITAQGLKSLRSRLGISAGEFGALIGVSGQSVYAWEQERSYPRAAAVAAIAQLRGIGKKDVRQRLEARAAEQSARPTAKRNR